MDKTILRLNKEISIIILSGIAILFAFLSDYSPIYNLISFMLVFIKSIVFVVVPLIIYVLEKNSIELKKVAGIYTSYFIINLFATIVASISIVHGEVSFVIKVLFDFINLIILLSSLFIFIEQILNYAEIKNKVYSATIMKIVYLVANFVSYPFLLFINKKIDNDKDS